MYYMQATSYCNWMVSHVQKVINNEIIYTYQYISTVARWIIIRIAFAIPECFA